MTQEPKEKTYDWTTFARGFVALVMLGYSMSRLIAILAPPSRPMLPVVSLSPTATEETSDEEQLVSVTIDDGDGGSSVWVRQGGMYRAKSAPTP